VRRRSPTKHSGRCARPLRKSLQPTKRQTQATDKKKVTQVELNETEALLDLASVALFQEETLNVLLCVVESGSDLKSAIKQMIAIRRDASCTTIVSIIEEALESKINLS